MRNLQRKIILPSEIPLQANQLNGGPAQIEIPSSDVETQVRRSDILLTEKRGEACSCEIASSMPAWA